jgi:GNAT superfamily N-acetyltransferase
MSSRIIDQESPFRFVALDQAGRRVGFATRARELYGQPLKPGQQTIEVFVEPEARGAGIGSALLTAIEQAARKDGASSLVCSTAPEEQDALAYMLRRGYTVHHEMLDGKLDLTRFDPSVWRPTIVDAEAVGYRFTTLLQGQDDPGLLQNLYELDRTCSEDIPEWSGVMPSFEEYAASLRACDSEAIIIAWCGDNLIGYMVTEPDGHTAMLGVLREYRGKQIALILKVLTAAWAKRKGLKELATNNNAASEAIIALNRKLGYVMRFGRTHLIKH